MDYNEAKIKAFKSKWKTSTCSSGEECWCRIIEPEETIVYEDGFRKDKKEKLYIVGSACASKEYAEYFVKLHNDYIDGIAEYDNSPFGWRSAGDVSKAFKVPVGEVGCPNCGSVTSGRISKTCGVCDSPLFGE